jgi:hypothetical protein
VLLAIASAFTCPVVIKQAEGSKVTPDTKPLIEEAKKLLAESKSHDETANTKRDHGYAVRVAKTAAAQALFLRCRHRLKTRQSYRREPCRARLRGLRAPGAVPESFGHSA